MKFTQIPSNTFESLQLNAGIIVDTFTPASGTVGNIIGATSGGVSFEATPTFVDFGDDIDNCPKNVMELKKLDTWEAKMTGTFSTIDPAGVQRLMGAGDIDSADATHIVPRNDVEEGDFNDVWWVGDYSDKNGTNGGFCAIHMMNALSTGGFKAQSNDKAKGQFAFEFTAHYSIDEQDTVPFEVYVKQGA